MDVAEHLDQLRVDGALMANAAAAAGPDTPIPTCPEWTMREPRVAHRSGAPLGQRQPHERARRTRGRRASHGYCTRRLVPRRMVPRGLRDARHHHRARRPGPAVLDVHGRAVTARVLGPAAMSRDGHPSRRCRERVRTDHAVPEPGRGRRHRRAPALVRDAARRPSQVRCAPNAARRRQRQPPTPGPYASPTPSRPSSAKRRPTASRAVRHPTFISCSGIDCAPTTKRSPSKRRVATRPVARLGHHPLAVMQSGRRGEPSDVSEGAT